MCDHGDTVPMWLPSEASENGWRMRPVDRCIAPLVAALRNAGYETVGSCCGHGTEDTTVLLTGGRAVVIDTSQLNLPGHTDPTPPTYEADVMLFAGHPYTCNGGLPPREHRHDHEVIMETTEDGNLRCPECGRIQTLAHTDPTPPRESEHHPIDCESHRRHACDCGAGHTDPTPPKETP